MIVCIPDILSRDKLKTIRDQVALLPFVDGKETAGIRAKQVKHNEQVSKNAEERKALQGIIEAALLAIANSRGPFTQSTSARRS
jgi:PKHD-type hydroxylase